MNVIKVCWGFIFVIFNRLVKFSSFYNKSHDVFCMILKHNFYVLIRSVKLQKHIKVENENKPYWNTSSDFLFFVTFRYHFSNSNKKKHHNCWVYEYLNFMCFHYFYFPSEIFTEIRATALAVFISSLIFAKQSGKLQTLLS